MSKGYLLSCESPSDNGEWAVPIRVYRSFSKAKAAMRQMKKDILPFLSEYDAIAHTFVREAVDELLDDNSEKKVLANRKRRLNKLYKKFPLFRYDITHMAVCTTDEDVLFVVTPIEIE